jgi:hypothetical protein
MAEDSETITIQLTVTAEQGSPRVPLTVGKKVSPTDLRKKTSEATKIPLSSLKLIYRGRLIADDDSKEAAAEFKLEDGSVIHCMGKPQKEASSGVSSATASVARASSSATTSLPTVSLLPPTAAAAATAPQPIGDPLRAALQKMRASSSAEDYMMGITTLKKILTNIVEHPLDEKYRLIKKQNPAYQRKLGSLTGGDEAMKAAGFEIQVKEGEEVYVMKATKEAWPNLVATKQTVESAMREVSASATSAAPAVGAPNVPMGSPDFMPPAAGMGPGLMMGGPGMDAMADQLMSDPNQLQAMLQVSLGSRWPTSHSDCALDAFVLYCFTFLLNLFLWSLLMSI